MNIPKQNATELQTKYIERLFIDIGGNVERHRRNTQLTLWVGREIKFLDDLSKSEASLVIEKLLEIKNEVPG